MNAPRDLDDHDLKIVMERGDADALDAMAKLFEVSPVYLLERCKLGEVLGFAYGELDEKYEVLAAMRQPDIEKAKRVCNRVKAFYPDCDVFAVDVLHEMGNYYADDTVYTVIVDDDGSYGRNSTDVIYVSEMTDVRPFLVRGADKLTVSKTVNLTGGISKWLIRALEEWKEATSLDVVSIAVHSFSLWDIKGQSVSDHHEQFVRLLLPLLSWESKPDAIEAGQKLDFMYGGEFVFYRYQNGGRHKLAFKNDKALHTGEMIFVEVKPKPLPIKAVEPSAFKRACGWLDRALR